MKYLFRECGETNRLRRLFQVSLGAIFSVACLLNLGTTVANADETLKIDFDWQIAPLLAARCLDCHNASDTEGGLNLTSHKTALTGGDSGEVLTPGDLDGSLLWDYVSTDEMPPKKPLTAAEKALLKTWIQQGAKWGTDPIDPFRYTSDARAGYDWWSLQPLKRPDPPKVENIPRIENGIDAFVRQKLADNGLKPSPEADRRVLIRRLTFDLLGLPPTPKEVDAFVADDSPDAYEQLVDRLLVSPHYGERWARHWLDVIRYGESQGFERDKLRENFWAYRDWVVNSLNDDMPYDEFVRLQLAGDILRPGDPAAIVATGFLVAGAYDEVGQKQQSAAMRAIVRQDELEDIAGTVGQTFLGLTVNCARCHDHKFDPVTTKEYYRLTAALAGVSHGEREFAQERFHRDYQARVAAAQAAVKQVAQRQEELVAPIRERILAKRESGELAITPPEPIAEWRFDGNLDDSLGELHGQAHGGAEVKQGRLLLNGKQAFVETPPLGRDLTAKTLEAWVTVGDLEQKGGGVLSVQSLDGVRFDAIVFGEQQSRHWMAGSNVFQRTAPFNGPAETARKNQLVHVAIVYSEDGQITGYRNGRPYGKPYQKPGPIRFSAGDAQVLFGLRHAPASGNRIFHGTIDRARLYDRALTAAEIAASVGIEYLGIDEAEILAQADEPTRRRLKELAFEETNLRNRLKRLTSNKTYTNVPKQAEVTHVLRRGNTTQPGEVVAAGGIAAVPGGSAEFGLEPNAPEGERRRKLAEWITNPTNPLFARIIANRIWHYHFGLGLVETPNDFGFNGGRPSHPELIDYLATELIAKGWSLKQLHRMIVLSATYRQASQPNDAALEIDRDNRLLWRKSPTRLEAEAVRDAVLSVSGQLNALVGGPGYQDFHTYMRNAQIYEMRDPIGASFNRRSLYRTWARSGRNRFLDAFDCPDPSTKTPARAVTTTPLQALSMMNNSFVQRMSQHFAERIMADCGDDPAAQIRGAIRIAYGRPAEEDEVQLGAAFVNTHGLPAYCRVLFNTNEFLYVD